MRTHLFAIVLLLPAFIGNAALTVKVDAPKQQGMKAVVKLTLRNGLRERIEGVRATVFLTDGTEKVVGQATRWIIGGTTEGKGLPPKGTTNYHFVIEAKRPVTSANLIVNRVLLEGGKVADVKRDVIVEK